MSERSDEESGEGLARSVETASGVIDFAAIGGKFWRRERNEERRIRVRLRSAERVVLYSGECGGKRQFCEQRFQFEDFSRFVFLSFSRH